MGVLMILTFLSMAVLARSTASLVNVRRTQNFSAALAAADAGLSDALYQIDQGQAATFTGSATVAAGTFDYTATKVDADTWSVFSKGTLQAANHAIKAIVSREIVYPYAIFTDQDLTFNGNGGQNITSYNSNTGATNTHHAGIGSNHAVTINGGGGGDEQDFYTPNGSCSGCPNGSSKKGPRTLDPPEVPDTYQPCPTNGVFSGTVNGGDGLTYLCNQNVTFSGTVTVANPPLEIYVGNGYSVNIADATVNAGTGSKGKDFELQKAGTGTFNVGTGSHAGTVHGIVYAPSTDVTVDGGQSFVDGSLTLNQLRINGNPNFVMSYDDSIMDITTDHWVVSDWREVPSNSG